MRSSEAMPLDGAVRQQRREPHVRGAAGAVFRALLLASALAAAQPAAAQEVGVAARVNGREISVFRLERHFEDYLKEQARNVGAIRNPEVFKRLKREALDQLIDKELLWQEAQRRGIEVADEAVREARARIAAGFHSREAFERRLRDAGFDAAAYDAYLRRELAARRVLEAFGAGVTVSDEEVARALAGQPAPLGMPAAEARARVRERLLAIRGAIAIDNALAALRAAARIERRQRL